MPSRDDRIVQKVSSTHLSFLFDMHLYFYIRGEASNATSMAYINLALSRYTSKKSKPIAPISNRRLIACTRFKIAIVK